MRIDDSIRAKWHGGKRSLSAITAIVFHYTANTGSMATAKGNARYFEGGSEGRKASAHYVVDEGEVAYECVPLDTTAWSVGDGHNGAFGGIVNNYNSVSIEMVSHTDAAGRYYIPMETQRHAAQLYAMLKRQLPCVKYAIRHYDVSLKQCPAPMIDEAAWAKFKNLLEEAEEVVEKSKMIVDGKEVAVERILKDGTNYVKVRDLAAALELDVSSRGNIAVLAHRTAGAVPDTPA